MALPDHIKMIRGDVRALDEYKDLTDEQADELITPVVGIAECLYHQFRKEEKNCDTQE